ncbi:MAG: PKD domain-containing protein [Bacteroidota bacterium]
MRNRVVTTLFFFFLLLCLKQAAGQGFTTKGTDFWLGFMENYLGDDTTHSDRMKVYITTDYQAASGMVSLPLNAWSQNFNVPPNSTIEITIPTDLVMCSLSDSIENKGVHVTSDNPISVYQLNYVKYTSDANINIPTISLGKRYRTTTYQPSTVSMVFTEVSVSELLVVAAYDSTVIRIVPKCNTQGGHGANIPFNISLNKGQVYQIKSYPSGAYSLTGSLVELDTNVANNCKPFAVFSGNQCAFIPGDSCCCNHICEQMMPVNTWGKQYITVPLKTRASDVFRFVGQKNGTIFTINGGLPHGLNAGGMYEENISSASFINSNYPISVAQFSKGAATDSNEYSDPFMIMINPLEQTIKRIVFNSFVTPIISSYYLNIITRTAYTNLVSLDGNNVGSSFLPVTSNPQYSYAQLTVTQGNHILSSDSGLIANVYGYGWYESFGYIAGATVKNLENSFNIATSVNTYHYYDLLDTLCRSNPLTFKATYNPYITDYYWNFGDGTPIVHGQTVIHNYTNPGSYLITYYYQRNSICGLDSIVWPINIKCCNALPQLQAPTTVCLGANASIQDISLFNTNATYTWNFDGGTVVSGTGQGPYQVSWSVTGTHTIWMHVSETNCSTDSAFFVIDVHPQPTADFTADSPLCQGDPCLINYTGNASAAANYLWEFSGAIVISGSGQGPYALRWNIHGFHDVKLTVSEGGCSASSTVTINIFPLPVPMFTADPQTTFVGSPLIHFTDNSLNSSSWYWNFGDSVSGIENHSTLQSPTHSYYNQGDYQAWLTVTSPDGCSDSSFILIQIIDFDAYYVPNAFTPDGDGLNDLFKPFGNDLDYTLYIYDRWGEQLFEGKNMGWDGKYQGSLVKQDTYTWLMIYSFNKGTSNNLGITKMAYGRVTVVL